MECESGTSGFGAGSTNEMSSMFVVTGYASLHQMCNSSPSKTASCQSNPENTVILGPGCTGRSSPRFWTQEIARYVSGCETRQTGESWFPSGSIQVIWPNCWKMSFHFATWCLIFHLIRLGSMSLMGLDYIGIYSPTHYRYSFSYVVLAYESNIYTLWFSIGDWLLCQFTFFASETKF